MAIRSWLPYPIQRRSSGTGLPTAVARQSARLLIATVCAISAFSVSIQVLAQSPNAASTGAALCPAVAPAVIHNWRVQIRSQKSFVAENVHTSNSEPTVVSANASDVTCKIEMYAYIWNLDAEYDYTAHYTVTTDGNHVQVAYEKPSTQHLEFAQQVHAAILKATFYPRAAILAGDSGVSTVSFKYTGGHVNDIKIRASSGSRVLDNAAVAIVSNADFPQPPPHFSTATFPITVPVSFLLGQNPDTPELFSSEDVIAPGTINVTNSSTRCASALEAVKQDALEELARKQLLSASTLAASKPEVVSANASAASCTLKLYVIVAPGTEYQYTADYDLTKNNTRVSIAYKNPSHQPLTFLHDVERAITAATNSSAQRCSTSPGGVVFVAFDYQDGHIGSVTIKKHGGCGSVDNAAIAAAETARYPPPPLHFEDVTFHITIPVKFP